MRCKTCDYALWNLKTRQCPECGAGFKPSDFTYVPNSVRFECPHCAQAYYGTDPNGHLLPRTFDCGRCGQRITMDEMVLRPTEGVKEEQTAATAMPWIERNGRSVISAWFKTVGMSLVQPGRMMAAIPGGASHGKAWTFALVTQLIMTVGALAPMLLVFIPMMLIPPRGAGGGPAAGALGAISALGGMTAGLFIGTIIFIPLWGLLSHLLLRLTGKCEGGIPRSLEAILYSSGANAISAIPCVGAYVGPIWWIVSAVIALKERQKVSGWRASLAAITPPLCLIALFIAGWIFLMYKITAAAGTFNVAMPVANVAPATTAQLLKVHGEILNYGLRQQGAPIPHPLALLGNNKLDDNSLVAPNSLTSPFLVRIDGTTPFEFMLLDPSTQDARVKRATTSVGAANGAVRMGDLVFTTGGVSLNQPDARLWLVMCQPDRINNPTLAPDAPVFVLLADGTVKEVASADYGAALAEQNAIRAGMNLPAIPSIEQVK